MVGITHFKIYDDGSTDNLLGALYPYIQAGTLHFLTINLNQSGIVEYIRWPDDYEKMLPLYNTNDRSYSDAIKLIDQCRNRSDLVHPQVSMYSHFFLKYFLLFSESANYRWDLIVYFECAIRFVE